jgi:hypothetical protein
VADVSKGHIPHLPIVIGFCVAAIIGYAVFSAWVVFITRDATMIGDTVGTWKSFAVAALAIWLGSSSGGQSKDDTPKVQIEQPPENPTVQVETAP